ncbi:protein lin-37 homolog [Daktulosphaira vitifoliae]|uniref:protein lin-37 homolog n=1 Tax=Daktulosphaira vitifoliae TaxID=58002 RepID=UPI0021AA865F|nr:protein lin-37 homolog [Daktulosphaira vitifoliae]XP_050533018.1 protein lin-37 homolog [Daktulosphaira vitifoliae]
MVKKRKNALRSSAQVVDSPMKEPRIIRGNQLEKARNSLNDALDIIAKKEQKKTEIVPENLTPVDGNENNKKSKKNETKQEVKDSLVLKLRDRSIDLASFTENTSMYTICRAWIKNDPLSARQSKNKKTDVSERSFKSDNDSTVVEDYVYKLPTPKIKLEIGIDEECFMPLDLPKDTLTTLDVKINPDEIATVKELLNEHRKRWLYVRQKWISFSNKNESRYVMSKNILTAMLNKDNSM